IDLMPHDLITQLLRVLAIETKQEKAMAQADPTELTLSGLEAFSFDYIVKWPLSLIINRCGPATRAMPALHSGSADGRTVPCRGRLVPRRTQGGSPRPSVPVGFTAARGHHVDCGVWAPRSRRRRPRRPTPEVLLPLLQESPHSLPDALQAHVLLQARGAAALQRLDQQQNCQAALTALRQVVRSSSAPTPCALQVDSSSSAPHPVRPAGRQSH
ncbi:hypothetical protein P7K49_024807, partial [Saguinus oedipus]